MHVEVFRAQRIAQDLGLLAPLIVEFFVVQQRYHGLVAQGRQIIDLEQFMAQNRVIAHAVKNLDHQLIDELTCRREAIDANPGFRLLIEHDVVQVVPVMPQAEFSTHTIMTYRRTKHLRNRRGKRHHHFLQTDDFFCQLRFILFGRKVFWGHDAS